MAKKPKCEECEYWIYSHVLVIKEKIWHCRDGFKPYSKKYGCCKDECKYNDRCKEEKEEE